MTSEEKALKQQTGNQDAVIEQDHRYHADEIMAHIDIEMCVPSPLDWSYWVPKADVHVMVISDK